LMLVDQHLVGEIHLEISSSNWNPYRRYRS
jgi:hypothetical protein